MSNITDVMVLAYGEEAAMRAWTAGSPSYDADPPGRQWRGGFTNIAEGDGARMWVHDGKGPTCDVWVGSFNGLNRPALLRDLEALPWDEPGQVQVLIQGQDDDCWGLWMITDDRLREVPLPGVVRAPAQDDASVDDGFVSFEVGMLERRRSEAPSADPSN